LTGGGRLHTIAHSQEAERDVARKHRLADMTFVEFAEAKAQNPTILIPLGSQEEQGTNAPMGDWMLSKEIAELAAERSGTISAPTIPFGYGDNFRAMPGGIQVRAETLRRLLRDVCDNFLNHGVTRLLIVNGHTGNDPLILETLRLIRRETGIVIPSINIWRLMTPDVWKAAFGEKGSAVSGHGAQPISSVYAHLFPELMRTDLNEAPKNGKTLFGYPVTGMSVVKAGPLEVTFPLVITDVTDNGVTSGDPSATSAEAGRIVTEHIVGRLVGFLETWTKVDPQAPEAGKR
jgi:creatinine amidohydrolase